MRMGSVGVPGALIFEPRRKMSAEVLSPVLGGSTPTTRAPGFMVIVTLGWTKTRPLMFTRQPLGQIWFWLRLPWRVVEPVHVMPSPAALVPPGPAQVMLAPGPVQIGKRVGLPARKLSRMTT